MPEGVGTHRLPEQQAGAKMPALVTTATTHALSLEEILSFNTFIGNNASTAVAYTLLPANKAMDGRELFFGTKGAAGATVYVAAGFGGASTGTDTITLAQGDGAIVRCDGSYWYSVHHTTGG